MDNFQKHNIERKRQVRDNTKYASILMKIKKNKIVYVCAYKHIIELYESQFYDKHKAFHVHIFWGQVMGGVGATRT